jgi:hypothetical protein
LDDLLDVSVLIGWDFDGQAKIVLAIPVVEEYLAKAALTGWIAERISGGDSLILYRDRFR